MGGARYLIPAPYTGISTRDAHLRRNPPSSEPGTDYYMPTGTPLLAPTRCRVVEIGGSIYPATGRFVTVDDGVRWLRFLHLADWRARPGDELDPGELFGISGASGYGSELFGESSRNAAFWRNTGGDHVHVTAFRGRAYTFGSSGTVDFHAMTGGQIAGGGASPLPNPTPTEDTLSRAEVDEIKAHVTAETSRAIRETPHSVMAFVIPGYIVGETPPTLGKLIRSLFQQGFTQEQRNALSTGYEPGVKLVRYAKSPATGAVFALYQGTDGRRYRFRMTGEAAAELVALDVWTPEDQSILFDYGPERGGFEIPTDFVESHPGELFAHVKSEMTGNVFALYRTSLGHVSRYWITDPDAPELADETLPVMTHDELISLAGINQNI